ncbi:Aspartyl-tRNA(Asn) amidotransferase subunit B [Mycoplasmopsis meleagridis]|uniref:Aspartyl/glutamyl-tRNA(Asn/Gln) amidotransferase subunit B n=1 Tax=Mycoplasmopsis meleagridis ATCC 25294 TaxID=1264554 RepID=A0A0F5H0E6_9BACT|nr:Asp-tRNA(Asn)/Glu-tRNA(Gln) amidotransferase subunit GatB [Mycoplasmopsis meleagridis]KKB26673.1 Aspartyl-tRNA(Asn) amidotransferase subunit B, Glutamyl-tRNA(Gln) amidotransferase subunit B [Mycoplasmopsis meleagridis ATCC 25294]OAD18212.1 Aspartyl-tRNA(Asn) amidotransferase subunit B [Mycoplasmopsis meleagridis]VEU77728.1 Aspartyl/glutamyl-tRNA(Asn/Gln) amidotransferase subunit B [Mycoplasmopsis meleagridis]
MNNFEVIIGIEIHLELNTKTKMFSPSENSFNANPNTLINQIDLGYPGTLPLVNKQAVIHAVKMAKALKMEIDDELHFDRKNYFYSDLPKGYQITQFYRPIGKNGTLKIKSFSSYKDIQIERIHLEEDTARQHHENDVTKLDYNRAGVPLIEIVSFPVIKSSQEAVDYVDMIRKVALELGISDAKLENGSLRADINISLRPYGYQNFGTKVEIKNINTYSNIKSAIDYEINLQTKKILTNEPILQQTKRFDEITQTNIVMRTKTGEIDYKYFPEPNIPFIKLSSNFLNNIVLEELPWEKEERYKKENINPIYINSLVSDISLAKYFDSINYDDRDKLAKLFFAELVSLANSLNKEVVDLNIKIKHIEEAIKFLDSGIISGKSFKKLITLLPNYEKETLEQLIKENDLEQISDPKIINNWINQVLKNNDSLLNEYKTRPERVVKQIVGNIMKISNGKANPIEVNKILEIKLNK